jgi:hypothetical protein
MKERPIIFSGESVRGILAGTKTQTRRIVNMRVPMGFIGGRGEGDDPSKWGYWGEDGWGRWYVLAQGLDEHFQNGSVSIRPPHGEPGDHLWIRETWAKVFDGDPPHDEDGPSHVEYRSDTGGARYPGEWPDDCGDDPECGRWKSPMYMHRWASRIDLEIVTVRPERLQSITEEDAVEEGMQFHDGHGVGHSGWRHDVNHGYVCPSAREAFAQAWQLINGKLATWYSNPWVWRIEFERLRPECRAKGATI